MKRRPRRIVLWATTRRLLAGYDLRELILRGRSECPQVIHLSLTDDEVSAIVESMPLCPVDLSSCVNLRIQQSLGRQRDPSQDTSDESASGLHGVEGGRPDPGLRLP